MARRPTSFELTVRNFLRLPLTHVLSNPPWTPAACPTSPDTVSLTARSATGSITPLPLPSQTTAPPPRGRRLERKDHLPGGTTLSISAHADCNDGRGGITLTASRPPAPPPVHNALERLWLRVRRIEKTPPPPAQASLRLSARRSGEGAGRQEVSLAALGAEAEFQRAAGEETHVRGRSPPVWGKTLSASGRFLQRKEGEGPQASGEACVRWDESEVRVRAGRKLSLSGRRDEVSFRLERESYMLKIGPIELQIGSGGPSVSVKSSLGVTTLGAAAVSHTRTKAGFLSLNVGACPSLTARRKVGKQNVTLSINECLAVETTVDEKRFQAKARVAAPRTGWQIGRGDKEVWVAVVRLGWFL